MMLTRNSKFSRRLKIYDRMKIERDTMLKARSVKWRRKKEKTLSLCERTGPTSSHNISIK